MESALLSGKLALVLRAIQTAAEHQAPGRLHLSYAFDLLSDIHAEHFRRFIHNDASVGGGFGDVIF